MILLENGTIEIFTGPSTCTTHDNNSNSEERDRRHWRQAAVLLSKPKLVTAGETIELEINVDAVCGVFCSLV